MQRLNTVVVVEDCMKLASGGHGGRVAAAQLLALIAALASLRRGRRKDGDRRLAGSVSGLELISVGQLKVKLIGDNLHGLSPATRFAGLRILPHARVLYHVKACGLILVLEIE